jgi:hypothetical protein
MKQYKNSLAAEWQDLGLERKEINLRLKAINGGITYDDYMFLQQGKQDRAKLGQFIFYR